MKSATADADPQARRTARVLYWVMRDRPGVSMVQVQEMDALLLELDLSIQKNVLSEKSNSSSELEALFGEVLSLQASVTERNRSQSQRRDRPNEVRNLPSSDGWATDGLQSTGEKILPVPPVMSSQTGISFSQPTSVHATAGDGTTSVSTQKASTTSLSSTSSMATRRMSMALPLRVSQTQPESDRARLRSRVATESGRDEGKGTQQYGVSASVVRSSR